MIRSAGRFRSLPRSTLYSSVSRPYSTQLPPRSTALQKVKTAAKWTGFFAASAVAGVITLGAGIFIHDAFTYNHKHTERVPDYPLINTKLGGPKNLPIATSQFRLSSESEETNVQGAKPKLVIVGGGWGALSCIKALRPGDYDVTVVCADSYSTFTPLLPSAAVGTVQIRSLVEPLRKLLARIHGHFVLAKAVDVSFRDRLLEVETTDTNGGKQNVYIPYDKLVIAVGSTSATHGVPGLHHCFQLKTVQDAKDIRRRVMDNFERASLPTTSPEERKRLLSFVVCGGGPTGVETAAEIYDLCQEDVLQYYPKVVREEVSIHVIQSREHILNTYSEAISQYAEDKFNRDGVNLITKARVSSVHDDYVVYTTKGPDGQTVEHTIPTNFVLWSTGIAKNPFTQRVTDLLPNQTHKKAIEVDAYLRVKGAPADEVYAVGDCATIESSLVPHFLEFVQKADKDENGKIDYDEWLNMVEHIKARIPMAADHVIQVKELFQTYDKDRDNALSLQETLQLLQAIGNKITPLPATAQVASQQGKYIGAKLRRAAHRREGQSETQKTVKEKPFKYLHLGSLAYIGNAAVFDLNGASFMGGLLAMYAWRSVYWSEQVSTRTRALLMIDWIIRGIWGRDLSRI